jgi:hypothetical protein
MKKKKPREKKETIYYTLKSVYNKVRTYVIMDLGGKNGRSAA